jgi:hypothetical protein
MAVTRTNNVIQITADNDTIQGPLEICSLIYMAGTTSPSAQIKMTNTSGNILWESGTTADNARMDNYTEICVGAGDTLHFDLAGTGTKLYLYTE